MSHYYGERPYTGDMSDDAWRFESRPEALVIGPFSIGPWGDYDAPVTLSWRHDEWVDITEDDVTHLEEWIRAWREWWGQR